MGVKKVALSDDVYKLLKSEKKEGESLDDVILRLVSEPRQKEILSLAGTWKGSEEETKRILDLIYKNRRAERTSRFDL